MKGTSNIEKYYREYPGGVRIYTDLYEYVLELQPEVYRYYYFKYLFI